MANINFPRYESMAKIHPKCVIRQRLLIDLQLMLDNYPDVVDEFVEFVCNKQNEGTPEHLKEKINQIALEKYQRMSRNGISDAKIAIVRKYDHLEVPQKDFKPVIDPMSIGVLQYGTDNYVDCVINSNSLSIPRTRSEQRAQEYRLEAGKRRKEFYKNLIDEVLIQSNTDILFPDNAPTSLSPKDSDSVELKGGVSQATLSDCKEVTAQDFLGEFYHNMLNRTFKAFVLLENRIFLAEEVLCAKQCYKLIEKLQFSEEEIELQKKLVENEIARGRVIMRTSMRRQIIHPKLAKVVWECVRNFVPSELSDGRKLEGIRAAMNFYRYAPGEFFDTHIDGGYLFRDSGICSEYTFILYLNSCEGGSTRFCDVDEWNNESATVTPKAGRLLVFRQRNQKHCGMPVLEGFKYIIQGMVMFSPSNQSGKVMPSVFHSAECSC